MTDGPVTHALAGEPERLSRRALLAHAGLLAFTAALAPLPRMAERAGLLDAAWAATPDSVIRDTLDGVAAYVVPGNDRFSAAQGVSRPGPGGVAARAGEGLRATLEISGSAVPDAVVTILNSFARTIDPGADNRAGDLGFGAPLPALAYAAKQVLFSRLSQSVDETLRTLGGSLPAVTAFLAYSEYGVLDAPTNTLTAEPVGWQLTGYDGVADGRNAFRGYFEGRRTTRTATNFRGR